MRQLEEQLDKIKRENSKQDFLFHLSQDSQLITNLQQLFDSLPDKIRASLGFDRIVLFKLNPEKALLIPVAAANVEERSLEHFEVSLYRSESLFTKAFLEMKPYVFNEKKDEEKVSEFDKHLLERVPSKSFVLIPLKRFTSKKICWEVKPCTETDCPAFQLQVNCWTAARDYMPAAVTDKKKKIDACLECDVFPGVGMIWADFGPKANQIDVESQKHLAKVGAILDLIIEKIELKESLQQRMEELESSNELLITEEEELTKSIRELFSDRERIAIVQVIQKISGVIDLEEMAQIAFRDLSKHRGFSRMMLFLADTENSYLEPVTGYGFPLHGQSSPEGFLSRLGRCRIASRSKNVLVRAFLKQNPVSGDCVDLHIGPEEVRKLLDLKDFAVIPISAKEKAIGVMLVDKKSYGSHINPGDLKFLNYFTSHISLGIEKAQLYQMLHSRKEELEMANESLLTQKQELEETSRRLENSTKEVIELQKQSEATLRNIADGLFTVDKDWKITSFNQAAERIIGTSDAEAIGQPCIKVIHGALCDKKCALRRTISTGEIIVNEESTVVNKRGETITIMVSTAALRDDSGNITGGVETFRDVTEMKRMREELKEANKELKKMDQMKSNFIAVLSHELRTPLTSIKGYNRVLASGKIMKMNEKAIHFLDIIDRQSNRLNNMIDELLDLTIIESGEMRIIKLETDYYEVVKRVADTMRTTAAEKNVTISFQVPPIKDLYADGEKLEHVLTNLLANAIKFTPESGEIHITAEEHDDDILTRVQDSGIGMTEEEREKIFQKFYQVDSSLTRKHSGVGLGLAIVKYIVEAHGGDIHVESIKGQGSTFIYRIPKK